MRAFIVLLIMFAFFAPAAEAGKALLSDYIITAVFDFDDGKRQFHSERRVFLSSADRRWFNLTRPRDGIALLARLVEKEQDNLKFEYLIVDVSRENGVVSTPKITTPIGQKTIVNLDRAQEKATLALVTNRKH